MSEPAELRKVLVLYTGGTIGMKRNHQGVLVPAPDVLTGKIKTCPELHDLDLARIYSVRNHELITRVSSSNKAIVYQIREYHPLLDSCNMTPKEWVIIAKNIEENYNDFDGFVILSGTDTMAFTASALSFMFKNLQKPIIITGAQIPIFDNPSDAKNHILSALVFASCSDIPEVCVYFSNKLFRGNRVKKMSCSQLDCFDSPNYPVLAEIGFNCRIYRHNTLPRSERGHLMVCTNLCERVGILYIFPTLTRTQLLSFLEPTLEGVVLITYGAGNIPSHRQDLLDVLRNAVGRGVTVVSVTQCIKGSVGLYYETGKCLEEIGVISCYDMTVEAAYAKLVVVCGMVSQSEERAELMKQVFRGEMTIQH
ncbi:60 kDa lysophospholipase [Dendroctonus ponderosae]|uniref:60 kDa lysophospholipase n=1 Tax=Dendroctonus ponderosae TaxID=77166 RepID=UPI002035F8CE|nr:60 kDa lysophospholipase [Dendroctonus ponderosae]